jgi:hypothetical protein
MRLLLRATKRLSRSPSSERGFSFARLLILRSGLRLARGRSEK